MVQGPCWLDMTLLMGKRHDLTVIHNRVTEILVMYLILSRKTPSVALEMTRQAPVRIGRLQRVSPTRGNLESGQYCGQVVRYAALVCIGTRQLLSILSIKSPAYYFTMKYHGLLMWDDYIIRLGWHNSQGPQTPNGSLQKARRILQY